MAKYWIKLYIEILDDPKMGRLPDRLYRRVIELLLLAGEIDDGGYLPDVVDMAWRLRADDDFQNDMTTIEETGIITFSPERQHYYVTQFAKRQAASTDAERKSYQRQRDRKQNPIVTKRDSIVTDAGQNFVQETDTESDTERLINTVSSSSRNIFTLYEQSIGPMTPMIAEELALMEKEYLPDWIEDAFRETARQNKHNLKYTQAILRSWRDNGAKRNGTKAEALDPRQYAEEIW